MSTKGFAGYSPAQREAVSRKGGSVSVPKGIAKLSPERRKEIATLGGRKRQQLKKENYDREKEEDSLPSGNESPSGEERSTE